MSLLEDVVSRFMRGATAFVGDKELLRAAVSAVSQVIVSDDEVHQTEVRMAVEELRTDAVLRGEYSTSAVEDELASGIARARTLPGRLDNLTYISAIKDRPIEQRNSVFLIAYDVAVAHRGLSEVEGCVLDAIANILSVEKKDLVEIARARSLLLGIPDPSQEN